MCLVMQLLVRFTGASYNAQVSIKPIAINATFVDSTLGRFLVILVMQQSILKR